MAKVTVEDPMEEDIKPNISDEEVKGILKNFYGMEGGTIKQMEGYDDLNYHCLPKEVNNCFLKSINPHGYVLKVMNSLDSKHNELCEAQNDMMLFLRKNKISSPVPIKNLFGNYYIKTNFPQKIKNDEIQKKHIVRLLEFQPGNVLRQIPKSFPLFYELGIFVAKLNEVLKNFHHPVYETHYSIWQLHSVPELKSLVHLIECTNRRNLVTAVLEEFSEKVLSVEDAFEKGMIHGDFNEHNVLMTESENGKWKVSAILDFGDSHLSCYLFELAISLCYMMFECKRNNLDPVIGAGYLIAGYLAVKPNFVVNYGILKICICARICQSLILGLKAFSFHPENKYVLDSQHMGWPLLEELWDITEEKITKTWESVVFSCKKNLIMNNEIINIES